MIIENKGKVFEKPDNGLFLGVLADIIYIKDKPSKFGPKDVARLVWILNARDRLVIIIPRLQKRISR